MHEKQLRIRYIRVLEKFFTRTVSLLKLEDFEFELFKQRTQKNFEDMNRTKAMDVHSSYLSSLKRFVDLVMASTKYEEKDFESTRQGLLKEANLILKDKNKNSYKKDKHKHKKFNDGY